jgi:hypothetical protein
LWKYAQKETFSNQHQHQRPFTAKDAEDAKEEKGLPRMDADERGSGHREIRTSENRNTPRMSADCKERRSAGKLSLCRCREVTVSIEFGCANEPGMPGERKPTQAVIAPEERAEVHAILG